MGKGLGPVITTFVSVLYSWLLILTQMSKVAPSSWIDFSRCVSPSSGESLVQEASVVGSFNVPAGAWMLPDVTWQSSHGDMLV